MRNIFQVFDGVKPAILMVVVHIAYTGVNVLYKLAANEGLNLRILIAYRWIFSSAFLVPLALIVERKSRPKLTRVVLFQAFLCGLFGGLASQNLYLESLALTSATYVTAISNLLPAITLILALSFRLENLEIKTTIGKAKVMGTIVGIGGAMLLSLYKGPETNVWSLKLHLLRRSQHQHSHISSTHVLGSSLAFGSCTSYALWLIVQTKMSKRYPCHYSSSALMSIMASIQCVILSLCMERNWSQWKLGWNLMLLTVLYSGIVIAGLVVVLIAWCVHVRGPVFVANFNPLSLLLTAIMGSLILEEKLHLGSILGAGLIVCGLYMVLWGKDKEMKEKLLPRETSIKSDNIEIVNEGDQPALNAFVDEDPLPKEQNGEKKLGKE
uniref:WAT1-related protein n=1 Tax=Manihot esculenta TaxID=3983 RepID=A0A2C9VJV1_MANES